MRNTLSEDPLLGRTRPLKDLDLRERLRYGPAFVGYPVSAFVVVLIASMLVTITEGAGVALIYPIIDLMQSGGDAAASAERSTIFRAISGVFAKLGIPFTFGWLMTTCAILIIIRQILTFLLSSYRASLNYRAVETIANRTFLLFTRASVDYAERLRSGTLINAILTEAKRSGTLATAVQNIIICSFRISFYVALLCIISWQATLASLFVLGILAAVFIRRSARSSIATGRRIADINESMTRYATERFGLLNLMKIAQMGDLEAANFAVRNASLRRMNVQINVQAARLNALIEGSVVIGSLAVVYAATEIIGMPLAALAVFLVAILRLMPVFQELAQGVQHISANLSALYSVDRVNLEAARAREPDGGTRSFDSLLRSITFDTVSFSYDAREASNSPALHEVSFEIAAGTTVALVGPSGAGKSTLIDLIPRLRHPSGGKILFDGIPADEFRLSDLRSQVALVLQDALVIDGTVMENMKYGNPDADIDAIFAAAKAAHAYDFILKLPKGFDTIVGERGVLLSGGQRQRLAMARALVRRASILLLDEPTSALDAESELAVQQALAELQSACSTTVIIVAHRLSTVRHADQIIVLDKGRVLGSGTHEELVRNAPWYRQIVELQLGQAAVGLTQSAIAAH